LPLISSTLTSAPLTGAAKIEPLIEDVVVRVSGVVDVLSLELLQAAIIPTEQATVVFNIRDFMFKVIHHLEFDNLKSV
jgi:hypothetical protein